MGDKINAKRAKREVGVSYVPVAEGELPEHTNNNIRANKFEHKQIMEGFIL